MRLRFVTALGLLRLFCLTDLAWNTAYISASAASWQNANIQFKKTFRALPQLIDNNAIEQQKNEQPIKKTAVFKREAYKYVGNRLSGKFHHPHCPFEQVMNVDHAVFFQFRCNAIDSGFIPCRYCLPPFVKQVRAVLLNLNSQKEVRGK